jgi:hemerythrin superfamily protein
MLVTDLIAQDHRSIQQLFVELEAARPPARELLQQLVEELDVHARAEEDVFYPAVREVSRRIDDAQAAHDYMRQVIDAVVGEEPGSRGFAQALIHLKRTVLNHAMEEESGVFLDAPRLGIDKLEALGAAMEEQKAALRGTRRRAA